MLRNPIIFEIFWSYQPTLVTGRRPSPTLKPELDAFTFTPYRFWRVNTHELLLSTNIIFCSISWWVLEFFLSLERLNKMMGYVKGHIDPMCWNSWVSCSNSNCVDWRRDSVLTCKSRIFCLCFCFSSLDSSLWLLQTTLYHIMKLFSVLWSHVLKLFLVLWRQLSTF